MEQDECTIEQQVPEITTDEVRRAVKGMKNGKAAGPGLQIELVKTAPIAVHEVLARLFNKCLQGEDIPQDWKKAHITSIYKKGDRRKCENYRGISITSSIGRLYGRVIKMRLEGILRDAEEQSGFCAGRSCTDNIFCLKQLSEKSISYGQDTCLTFVDLRKAYDTVPMNKLWNVMRVAGTKAIYVKAVKHFYENNVSAIKIGKRVSGILQVTKGLRQGCAMAPTLFKTYIKEALKKWKQHCETMGIPINDKFLYTLLFPDDQE